MKMLDWIFPRFVYCFGGDSGGGGGDGGFAERQQAEEARKATLRSKINSLYGLGGDEESAKAAAQLTDEEGKLAGATRGFYEEDLKHSYDRAKRSNTFALADRGLLGGKAQIDTEAELNRDNTLGATRLEDEVRAAVAALKGQREGERLNATNLVNAGAGEDAVAGAQAGLTRALSNASATRKTSIAGDLFTAGADSVAAGQNAALGPLALQQYRNSLKTFFGNNSGDKATVTGTS